MTYTHDLPASLCRAADWFETSQWASARTVLREIWMACDDKGPGFTGESHYLDNVDIAYHALADEANCDVRAIVERLDVAYQRHELPALLRGAARRIRQLATSVPPRSPGG